MNLSLEKWLARPTIDRKSVAKNGWHSYERAQDNRIRGIMPPSHIKLNGQVNWVGNSELTPKTALGLLGTGE